MMADSLPLSETAGFRADQLDALKELFRGQA